MLYFLAKSVNNETVLSANRFLVDLSPSNVVYRFDRKFDGENDLGIGNYLLTLRDPLKNSILK